ncbi:hypothetical protein SAZ11_06330 [Streptomyces sp. FXJ1.4098]|nr:hypothetical protein [Streptomyces sp. FXJ1.4098]
MPVASAAPGWLELPALQRTVAEPKLVTDPSGFRDSLDTWRDSSFLTPLGHLVSPEAPSGLGTGSSRRTVRSAARLIRRR